MSVAAQTQQSTAVKPKSQLNDAKEINIIMDSTTTNIKTASPEERELIFEQLSFENPDWTRSYIDSFSEMQTEALNEDIQLLRPVLKELLLRKVINMTRPQIAIPIITSRRKSPAVKPVNAQIIKFDEEVNSITVDDLTYLIPRNEEVSVTGLKLSPFCVEKSRVNIRSGYFKSEQIRCDPAFDLPNYNKLPDKITFGADAQTMKELNDIFNYISMYIVYFRSIEAAQIIYAQLRNKLHVTQYNLPFEPKDESIPDILKLISSYCNIGFSTRGGAHIADLMISGFLPIYYRALASGKDDTTVVNMLNLYKQQRSQMTFQATLREKLTNERYKLGVYLSILEKKVSVTRLKEIQKRLLTDPFGATMAKSILGLLTAPERKLVETEYAMREKYLIEVADNKCPHVRLYKQFKISKDDFKRKKLFESLKDYFKNPKEQSTMITCKACNFNIMCPHLRDFTELSLINAKFTEIKAQLTKYIADDMRIHEAYCRICSEQLSSIDAFDIEDGEHPNAMDDDLKLFIWGEIISTLRYFHFATIVDVPKLISACRDSIYNYVAEIEKSILRAKTNSAEIVKAKKKLYTTIYVFAYFIHICSRKNSSISFKEISKPSQQKVRGGGASTVVDMIKLSIDAILMSRNVIIRQIPGMTADIIKNSLIDAYKIFNPETADIAHNGATVDTILSTLLLDPVYMYFYNMYIAMAVKKLPRDKFGPVTYVDDIMGAPVAKLEKYTDIFADAYDPKFSLAKKTNVFSYKDIGALSKSTEYYNILTDHCKHSFAYFYAGLNLHVEPLYLKGEDSKFRPLHSKQAEHAINLQSEEKYIISARDILSAQTYSAAVIESTRQWINPHSGLGRIYDEDGSPHKWGIFICEDGDKQVELTAGDISKQVESGKLFTSKILDKKCTICNINKSQVASLENDKIRESLHTAQIIQNFFRFYENRCPKGGLHTGDKCTKCGFMISFVILNDKNALTYYHTYHDQYVKERTQMNDTVAAEKAKPVPKLSKYAEEYAKWSPNYQLVLELANRLHVNHKVLSALGATEKQEYSSIQSGVYHPREAESRYDTRIYVITAHIKNLLTEYNQIKFFHQLIKPSRELTEIIDNSGIDRHKLNTLPDILPDVYNDFNARFAYIQQHKRPNEIVEFVKGSFCDMCLRIYDDSEKSTSKLRQSFVKYFVEKTIRNEELVSKPGYFNWSVLYGVKESKDRNEDMNYNPDLDKETDRDFDETKEEDDDFGSTGKPMEADFDMEIDPDNPDDEGNDLHVGDEYGL